MPSRLGDSRPEGPSHEKREAKGPMESVQEEPQTLVIRSPHDVYAFVNTQ